MISLLYTDDVQDKYCICCKEEYGDMIACDSTKCSVEWFYSPCVGLSEEQEGDWFCMDCREKE